MGKKGKADKKGKAKKGGRKKKDRKGKTRKKDRDQGGQCGGFFFLDPGEACDAVCADRGSTCDLECLEEAANSQPLCKSVIDRLVGAGGEEGSGCICKPGEAPNFRIEGYPVCQEDFQSGPGEKNVCSCGGRPTLLQAPAKKKRIGMKRKWRCYDGKNGRRNTSKPFFMQMNLND